MISALNYSCRASLPIPNYELFYTTNVTGERKTSRRASRTGEQVHQRGNDAVNDLDGEGVDDSSGDEIALLDDGTFAKIDSTAGREISSVTIQFIGTINRLYLNSVDREWRYWALEEETHVLEPIPGSKMNGGRLYACEDPAAPLPSASGQKAILIVGRESLPLDMTMEPTVVANYECELGEGVLWDPDRERLYWCDITQGRIFQYNPGVDAHEQLFDGGVVGGFTVQTDGSLLLFMGGGTVKRWKEGSTTTVIDKLPAESDSRFNDVVADPRGRVFCGTMPTDTRGGRLYRLDTDGTITELWDDLEIPNGMGFSPNEEVFYLVESEPALVHAFDYDPKTGSLSNRRVFADTADHVGVPDGLTVDADGYVWTARWDGASVVRYAPDATIDFRFELPVPYVTSLCFGGPSLDDVYVTTARWETEKADDSLAGALFRFTPPSTGKIEYASSVI